MTVFENFFSRALDRIFRLNNHYKIFTDQSKNMPKVILVPVIEQYSNENLHHASVFLHTIHRWRQRNELFVPLSPSMTTTGKITPKTLVNQTNWINFTVSRN